MGAREPQKQEKEKVRFVIQEVPTQTRPLIIDTKTKEAYDELTMLCRIANELERLRNN